MPDVPNLDAQTQQQQSEDSNQDFLLPRGQVLGHSQNIASGRVSHNSNLTCLMLMTNGQCQMPNELGPGLWACCGHWKFGIGHFHNQYQTPDETGKFSLTSPRSSAGLRGICGVDQTGHLFAPST